LLEYGKCATKMRVGRAASAGAGVNELLSESTGRAKGEGEGLIVERKRGQGRPPVGSEVRLRLLCYDSWIGLASGRDVGPTLTAD
jgi:hypothetical protein